MEVPRDDSKKSSTQRRFFLEHPLIGRSPVMNPVVPKTNLREGPPPPKSRRQLSSFHDYVISILIALVFTVFYGGYYWAQRKYFFNAPPAIDALYVPDKVIAVVGLIILAFTLL